jgi:hypothetical protein
VLAEYAKAAPDDILIRLTIANRGPEAARLHLLPTLWFRNTWSWGSAYEEGRWPGPRLEQVGEDTIVAEHATLGRFRLVLAPGPDGKLPPLLFTENETNGARLYGTADGSPYVKDAFHEYVVHGKREAVNLMPRGTKATAHYRLEVPPLSQHTVCLRLTIESQTSGQPFGADFDRVFEERLHEAETFYAARIPQNLGPDEQLILRQAYAGLLWSEQFYHWVVSEWLQGDRLQPNPPDSRWGHPNAEWCHHLYCRDVLSVPDKWEYPAFFAWDLAFQMLPLARIDPELAKYQLLLFLREWYMHPSGQLASRFAVSAPSAGRPLSSCFVRVVSSARSQSRANCRSRGRSLSSSLLHFPVHPAGPRKSVGREAGPGLTGSGGDAPVQNRRRSVRDGDRRVNHAPPRRDVSRAERTANHAALTQDWRLLP